MKSAVFVIRVLLGALLIVTGALKVGHHAELASAIAGFRLLTPGVIGPLALLVPYLELMLGVYLASGLLTRGIAVASAIGFVVYAAAIASAVIRHIPAIRGCFGPGDVVVADWPHVGFDVGLAAASAFVAWGAPGAWALDVRLLAAPAPARRSAANLTIALFGIVVAAAFVGYAVHPPRDIAQASQAAAIGKAQVGQPAPQFAVATTSGLFDLEKTDKPVLLEVFATWCPHCQRETSVVDRLFHNYGSRVAFVAVSGSPTAMDHTSDSSPLDVLNFAQQFNVQYPIAYDPRVQDPNDQGSVVNLYLQGGFPTFAVIGKDKNVTYLDSGEIAYNDLAAELEKVLR